LFPLQTKARPVFITILYIITLGKIKKKGELQMKVPNQEQKVLLITLLKCNFKAARAAEELHYHRNSIPYQVKKLNKDLGIDCKNFLSLYEYLQNLPAAERKEILKYAQQ